MLLFRELNRGKCKTYVVACARTRKALLIDPVREHVSRDLAFLAYHLPLRGLAVRAAELEPHRERPIVAVCRSGVRSTTAAAILEGLGFERVYNLKDGMVDWNDRKLPIER